MIFDDFASVPTALSEPEFEAECSALVTELRAGMQITIGDICHRLGVSHHYLEYAAARLFASQTGRPVMLYPPTPKGRLQ